MFLSCEENVCFFKIYISLSQFVCLTELGESYFLALTGTRQRSSHALPADEPSEGQAHSSPQRRAPPQFSYPRPEICSTIAIFSIEYMVHILDGRLEHNANK